MKNTGPIIVIDDDADDLALYEDVFHQLQCPNQVLIFLDVENALEFINMTVEIPFLIIADIYMPRITGIELAKLLKSNPRQEIRSVPFILFSTDLTHNSGIHLVADCIQGLFEKPVTMKQFEDTLGLVVNYWNKSIR